MQQSEKKKETALPDIFEVYCFPRQTARLTVNYADGDGVFYFDDGELIEAQMGALTGEAALQAAARMKVDDFRLDLDVQIPPRTIYSAWADLLTGTPTEAAATVVSEKPVGMTGVSGADSGVIEMPDEDTYLMCEKIQVGQPDKRGVDKEDLAQITDTGQASTPGKLAKENSMNTIINQQSAQTFVPTSSTLLAGLSDYQGVQESLTATGIVMSGVVVDEDGVIVGEVGDADAAHAQTAYLIVGLEALVSSQFDLGPCEGALLDQDGVTMLISSACGLACAFVPAPRLPVARAFHDTRHALASLAGEIA